MNGLTIESTSVDTFTAESDIEGACFCIESRDSFTACILDVDELRELQRWITARIEEIDAA